MPRRGLCRCGTVLAFESGPGGYKMRCPQCGAVVRLRADEQTRQRQRSGVLAFRPPAPSDPEVPSSSEQTPLVSPDQYDYDALRPGELPVVEMVPLSSLAPVAAPSFWRRRWLPLTATLVAAISTIVAACILRG